MSLADDIRTDWTRDEIAGAVRPAAARPALGGAARASPPPRANEVQLSTLLSIKTGGCPEDCGYCSQSAHAATGLAASKLMDVGRGARRRRRGQGGGLGPLLHGRRLARAQGPRPRRPVRDGRRREGDGPRDLHDAGHADPRAGRPARRRRARLLQPQSRHLARILWRDHPPAATRTGSTRWRTSAPPAWRSAAAASSAWARAATTGSASCTRWRRCRPIPRACRSTRWCRSGARARRHARRHAAGEDRRSSSSSARSRWRGS